MSFLRRRADAPVVASPGRTPDIPVQGRADSPLDGPLDRPLDRPLDAVPARRPSRSERKALKAEQAAAAERAARVARAQRRLAQATGPLPVVTQRRSPEDTVPTE